LTDHADAFLAALEAFFAEVERAFFTPRTAFRASVRVRALDEKRVDIKWDCGVIQI